MKIKQTKMYIVIRNKYHKNIPINLMGHFKVFIKKYIDNDIYFIMKPENMYVIYSSYIINENQNEYNILICDFERKYNDYIIYLSDKLIV